MRGSPYYVIVCDLFNLHAPDHETIIAGFPTRELAIEYARRRTWSSIDEMREPNLSVEHIHNRWLTLGEDCRVIGPEGVVYVARSELETFLSHPLPSELESWTKLYRSLLPDDFALTYEWASGSMPPPYHYEYTLTVTPKDQGRILFWPDYPSTTCPRWDVPFYPDLTSRILLNNWMNTTNYFTQYQPSLAEPSIGGETGQLQINARGKQANLEVHKLPPDERSVIHQLIRAIVPDMVWEKLDEQRKQYITSTYPKREE